jgi:hypothetical protein
MKLQVTFKTPDAAEDAIIDEAQGCYDTLTYLKEFVSKWVRYGEYITVEFNTTKGTAEVLPVERL